MGFQIRSCHIVCLFLVVSAECWPATVPVEPEMAAQALSNASSLTPQTKDLSKKVNLVLTVFVFTLTAATYWILMRYTPDLSHEISLPSKFLEQNIAAILSKAWPVQYMGSSKERLPDRFFELPWIFFYKARSDFCTTKEADTNFSISDGANYSIHGSSEVSFQPAIGPPQHIRHIPGKTIRIRTFSPVMRSLVQASVWNAISSWLTITMVINTVVYNGFTSNNLTKDSVIRLVLVGLYAVANVLARRLVSAQLYHNFTCATFQTCWTFLCSDFLFVNGDDYSSHRTKEGSKYYMDEFHAETAGELWTTLGLELFGKAERSKTYHPLQMDDRRFATKLTRGRERNKKLRELFEKRCRSHVERSQEETKSDFDKSIEPVCGAKIKTNERASQETEEKESFSVFAYEREKKLRELHRKRCQSYMKPREDTESEFDKFIKPIREAEIKAYEKAAETVLERVLANIAALLGICLATALAPWTSTEKNDATSSQLGSYALLLTISTGFLAMTGIFGQLTNATESARTLLRLQERTIHAAATNTNTANSPLEDNPPLSFSEGIKDQLAITSLRLWSQATLRGKLGSIFLGPALTLIPRLHRNCTDREDIYFKVRDEVFGLNTDFEEFPGCSARLFRPTTQSTSEKTETA